MEDEDARRGSLARGLTYLGLLTAPLLTLRLLGENVTLSDGIFGLAVLVALLSAAPAKRPDRSTLIPAFLLLLGSTISGFATPHLGEHLLVAARLVFVVGVLPWLARKVLRTRTQVAIAAGCWLTGVMVDSVVAVIQTRVPSFFAPAEEFYGRVTGLTDHPSDAGALLSAAIPVLMAFAIGCRGRAFWLGGGVLAGMALLLSGSVSGFAAAVVGGLVVGWRLRIALRVVVLGVVGAVVALYLSASYLDRLGLSPLERFRSTTSGPDATASIRAETWRTGWEWIQHDPIVGRGLDVASGITTAGGGEPVHNIVLLLWAQGGLAMLAGILLTIRIGRKAVFGRNLSRDVLKSALAGSLVSVFVFAMTSPATAQRYIWIPFALALALPTKPEPEPEPCKTT